jgi:hypothetical protein
MTPNPAAVEALVDSMLVVLGEQGEAAHTINDTLSAVFTLTDRLLRVCVDYPGVNVEVLRNAVADLYQIFPPETKN